MPVGTWTMNGNFNADDWLLHVQGALQLTKRRRQLQGALGASLIVGSKRPLQAVHASLQTSGRAWQDDTCLRPG